MYAGFKFARRKYRERQARKTGYESQEEDRQAIGRTSLPNPQPIEQTQSGKAVTPEEKADERRRRIYSIKVVLGLCLPFCLQALDTTIVAAALPTIAQEFNSVSQQNWIISVFNLTSATFLPFWAQASDIFGRHSALQLAIALTMVGSAVCTGSPTHAFPALLAGRALQGAGAAGINMSVRVILADGVSLADYARNWSLFSLMAAIGYTVGPVAGGYLTAAGAGAWRWCFAINLPVGALGMATVPLLLRRDLLGPQPLPELEGGGARAGGGAGARLLARLSTVDVPGQFLFLVGLGLFILALTWAGDGSAGTYAWASAAVLAPLVIGAVLTAAWFGFEYSMAPPRAMSRLFKRQRPMMPWLLFEQRDISILFFVNFCLGMCLYSVMYFMDYYFQYVQGQSASDAGTGLLYFLPGLAAGAYMAVFMVNRWPRQTIYPLMLGSITSAVAVTVLIWAINAGKVSVVYGMMALAGHGVGIRMSPSSMHGLAYFPANTAQITCVFAFAMPFGGAVGMTIMSAVWNNKLGPHDEFAKSAIMYSYYAILPFMWLCVVACTFLGNVWVKKDGSHEVVNGAYLWSLITRKKLARETRHRGGSDWTSAPAPEEQMAYAGQHRKEVQAAEPV